MPALVIENALLQAIISYYRFGKGSKHYYKSIIQTFLIISYSSSCTHEAWSKLS